MEFEEYVRARRAALFRFAVVLTADPVLADELVGDVLSGAFERWGQVSRADNMHAYVRRMLLNEFLTRRRRRTYTASWSELGEFAEPAAEERDRQAEEELLAEVRRLPAKQRAALVLRYYEGMSFAEIAELLGSGENAVRSNISRALARLRITMTDPAAEQRDDRFPDATVEARR